MKYKKHLNEPWFTLVCSGKKTCEGRLNKGEFANMQKDDTIEFYNKDLNKTCKVIITDIHHYKSFEDMIRKERLKNCLPDGKTKTIEDGVKIYHQFYSKEDEDKFGVIGIIMKVI